MRRCKVSERLAAYLYLCYSFTRSAGGLSTFSILVPLLTSARLCTCLFGLRSRPRGLIDYVCTLVAERVVRVRVRGRIVRVHRQRRQVRVVRVVTATEATHQPSVQPPYHSKELNLTSDGYSDSLAPFGRWHGFRMYCGSDTSAIHKPQQNPAGVYREKFSVSSRLTAALVLRRGAALSGRAVFVVALSRSSVFVFYSAIRQQVPNAQYVLAPEGA